MNRQNQAMKQESFHILEDSFINKVKVVRQNRVALEPGKCTIEMAGHPYEVLNISHFGFGLYMSEADFNLFNQAFPPSRRTEGRLFYSGIDVQSIEAKALRTEPYGVTGGLIVGFEILGEPVILEKLLAIEKGYLLIKRHQDYTNRTDQIPNSFRAFTYEFKDLLQELKEQIDLLEEQAPQDNYRENRLYREGVVEIIGQYLAESVPSLYQKIPQLMQGITKEQVELCTLFIRKQVGPFIYGAPFANRAFNKPRGYAGDYEMMNHLYRSEILGRTLFDQCMHKYFVDEPAAEAVKNRGLYLKGKISRFIRNRGSAQKPLRILSVASGPAMEVQLFLAEANEFKGWPIEFFFIDQDEESLIHAQKQISTLERCHQTGFKFIFQNLAIRNIIMNGLPRNDFDLIYTAGLFDYFTDPVATTAAQKLFSGLNKGGELIIGNYSSNNPTAVLMEILLDWHLIYRSEDDLRRLFKSLCHDLHIEEEDLKINYFAVLR